MDGEHLFVMQSALLPSLSVVAEVHLYPHPRQKGRCPWPGTLHSDVHYIWMHFQGDRWMWNFTQHWVHLWSQLRVWNDGNLFSFHWRGVWLECLFHWPIDDWLIDSFIGLIWVSDWFIYSLEWFTDPSAHASMESIWCSFLEPFNSFQLLTLITDGMGVWGWGLEIREWSLCSNSYPFFLVPDGRLLDI